MLFYRQPHTVRFHMKIPYLKNPFFHFSGSGVASAAQRRSWALQTDGATVDYDSVTSFEECVVEVRTRFKPHTVLHKICGAKLTCGSEVYYTLHTPGNIHMHNTNPEDHPLTIEKVEAQDIAA